MLRTLPFQTIGDIGRHGLELHVYCPSCCSTRRLSFGLTLMGVRKVAQLKRG